MRIEEDGTKMPINEGTPIQLYQDVATGLACEVEVEGSSVPPAVVIMIADEDVTSQFTVRVLMVVVRVLTRSEASCINSQRALLSNRVWIVSSQPLPTWLTGRVVDYPTLPMAMTYIPRIRCGVHGSF